MLRMIPRSPRKIAISDIQSRLQSEYGYNVNVRTLQRDLQRLSDVFELELDDRSKPYGWSWRKGKAIEITPGMEPHVALTFYLAEKQLTPQLPPPALDHLKPYFSAAERVLKGASASPLSQWRKNVRVVADGQRLIPAKIGTDVFATVYQALLENRRFYASYTARDSKTAKEYEVNPLGLVVRNAVTYLVCTLWEYKDIRIFSLHRMRKATLIDKKAAKPPGFNLDAYINSGAFGFPGDKGEIRKIRLKALFEPAAAYHLYELSLSPDQKLTEQPDGRVLLEATVMNTGELQWWLQAFGDQVEVVGPKHLRTAFAVSAARQCSHYQ